MNRIPVILIFDIGKTNKKFLLFNNQYDVVFERTVQLAQQQDEDGFECENLDLLKDWVYDSLCAAEQQYQFNIRAIHYAAYGASFVYLNQEGQVIAPLYNYLKPYKETTKKIFVERYGPMHQLCLETASPDLNGLNSGLQLFRMKIEQPELFANVRWALHLPQYIHYLITKEVASDLTSIGCHTMLWDFTKKRYHDWVFAEGLDKILPPLKFNVGLHDSSAALIPYQETYKEPFVLISTGTWCISLNPFNKLPLTENELNNDTLCYLSYKGQPIKASRLHAGMYYEKELALLKSKHTESVELDNAHDQLMNHIINEHVKSTNLVLNGTNVRQIFVDGGFSKNERYLNGLKKAYSNLDVCAVGHSQASALGAAMSIHNF